MQTTETETERVARERSDLYRRVFATEDGLKVLRDLSHVYASNSNPFGDHFDPIRAAVAAGQKEVVFSILKLSQ